MKKYPVILLLLLIQLYITAFQSYAGRCTGSANCRACSNCSLCKHCSKQGGSCGVCAGGAAKPVYEDNRTNDRGDSKREADGKNNSYNNSQDDNHHTSRSVTGYDKDAGRADGKGSGRGISGFWWILLIVVVLYIIDNKSKKKE